MCMVNGFVTKADGQFNGETIMPWHMVLEKLGARMQKGRWTSIHTSHHILKLTQNVS